ncbi:MAG: Polyphosphate glucokinase [uncultured Chthoniobacterales bacterium]|uniref:Polyphosphate glucokinase n=1 Tax=uncultured Chthoniobacterales bacterium TaxID=1836801 RepID=A0A6J4I5H9_9BACT|nr:MAG: Polyphosphate glucokinase [uncultured Chthoniobacterales bacterium]
MKKKILVVDIGGTNVKLLISRDSKRKFPSGKTLSPADLVAQTKEVAEDWEYDAVAIGFPSVVKNDRIVHDPKHLAAGWAGFDFKKSFGKPTRIINDAAMQALGSYHGDRMLFLGLGTGLGSTLIWGRNVMPLELGDLPYPGVTRIEDVLGKRGLERLGRRAWRREVHDTVAKLKVAFIADYVVLGGGNAKNMDTLPEGVELGHNRNAYLGGVRLWETDAKTRRAKWQFV